MDPAHSGGFFRDSTPATDDSSHPQSSRFSFSSKPSYTPPLSFDNSLGTGLPQRARAGTLPSRLGASALYAPESPASLLSVADPLPNLPSLRSFSPNIQPADTSASVRLSQPLFTLPESSLNRANESFQPPSPPLSNSSGMSCGISTGLWNSSEPIASLANDFQAKLRLGPQQTPPNCVAQQTRARSYSTNNALSNVTYLRHPTLATPPSLESSGYDNRPPTLINPQSQIVPPPVYTPQMPHIAEHTRPRATTVGGPTDPQTLKTHVTELSEAALAEQGGTLITSLSEPSLGPQVTLCCGPLPRGASPALLVAVFRIYGPVKEVSVIPSRDCALVVFESIEAAMTAKAAVAHTRLLPDAEPLVVAFARIVPIGNGSPAPVAASGPNLRPELPELPPVKPPGPAPNLAEVRARLNGLCGDFRLTRDETAEVEALARRAELYKGGISEITPPGNSGGPRMFDAPYLREIRKRLDATCGSSDCAPGELPEVERLAILMLDEISELASDYLGNTVVQKLFAGNGPTIRAVMLRYVAPYLAQIGIHKNGTWAAQKIVNVAQSPREKWLISESLRRYAVPLFNDQFGNYVLQGCLKFGSPGNDFLFETAVAQFSPVAHGRFGARAVRACLESPHASRVQQAAVAAVIVLNAAQLATDVNGSLLLTWFLDTCTLPLRPQLLVSELEPHLAYLCTHKLGNLTILKIINHRNGSEARIRILRRLFRLESESEETGNTDPNTPTELLQTILRDKHQGPSFIYKLITTPYIDESVRAAAVAQTKVALLQLGSGLPHGYKRLLEEVGLGVGSSGGSGTKMGKHFGSSHGNHNRNLGVYNHRVAPGDGAEYHYGYEVPNAEAGLAGYRGYHNDYAIGAMNGINGINGGDEMIRNINMNMNMNINMNANTNINGGMPVNNHGGVYYGKNSGTGSGMEFPY